MGLTLSPRHTSVHDKELVSLALSLSFFTTPPHAPPNGTRVHSRLYRPPVNTQKESMHFSTTTTLVLSALSVASFNSNDSGSTASSSSSSSDDDWECYDDTSAD